MNKNTQNAPMPANIALDKWADIGFYWQGAIAVTQFERLAQQLDIVKQQDANAALDVVVTLKKQQNILWLSYQVKAVLWLACQRCLSPLSFDVSGEYRLAILYHDNQIAQVNDAEFVLVDEICIGERQMLPIQMLLEDELLLALPLAVRHEDCQMLAVADDEDEDEKRDNPFAVLVQLKADLPTKS